MTAPTAEFLSAGKPVAQPIYLVDANGNPISSTNALNVNASFSASSVAINDPNTTTQKMAVDASGNASVKLGAALPTGTNVIGHIVVDSAGNVSITSLPSLPAGTNVIGHVIVDSGTVTATNPSVGTDGSAIPASSTLIGASDGTNLQQLLVESATNRNLRTGIYQGANEVTVTGANALKVDNSAVTQPVSGTVTTTPPANASTNITQIGGAALSEGQQTMANSVPVVIASNQSNIPENLTQVGGAAIALGQTTKANSLPVTLASDQAEPVNTGTPSTETNVSVGTSSAQVLAANTNAKYRAFCNDSANTIYLAFAGTAVVGKGIRLNANGGSIIFDRYIPTGTVNAIASGASSNLTVTEG